MKTKALKRIAFIIAALLAAIALTGCVTGDSDLSPSPTIEIISREIPRLLILLPEETDDFYGPGYGYFLSEIDRYSADYRFNYDTVYFTSDDDWSAILSPENVDTYDWIYLHIGGGTADGQLTSALDALPEGKQLILFDENTAGYTPDYHIYIDYREMGVAAGEYMNGIFAPRYGTGALEALCFESGEPWFGLFIDGIKSQVGGNIELRTVSTTGADTDVDSFLSALSAEELQAICCVISADGARAKDAIADILSFKGSLNLKVELVAFIGAESEYIDDFTYSPINQITFDVYPTMMANAAKYVRDVVLGDAGPERSITAELLDKNNIELHLLSDEYLLRYAR